MKIFYVQGWGAKSFVDDLDTGQSVVFSRAAIILRSIETKLLIGRFVDHFFNWQKETPELLAFPNCLSRRFCFQGLREIV
jgi:hypothetical protein